MRYPSYNYPIEVLSTGSSLGNRLAFALLDSSTDLRGLWSSVDNQFYVGEWRVEVFVNGRQLVPRETLFSPESQTTFLSIDDVRAEKQFFLPFSSDASLRIPPSDLQSAIFLVRLMNLSPNDTEVLIRHLVTFPAVSSDLFTKKPPDEQTRKRARIQQRDNHCEIITVGKESEARVFGSTAVWSSCSIDGQTLIAEYRRLLGAGESLEIPFCLSFSPEGPDEAFQRFLRSLDARKLLELSVAEYREILSRSFIITPEPVINRGLQWAKVNAVRVQHQYRIGMAFTNDPPEDIVVIRDVAWYLLGADYLTPEFCRALLELCEKYAFHEGGKLTEFIGANDDPPQLHDYDLNINDDTPLYVYAVCHHAFASEDDTFLGRAYPLLKRACDWILSQIDEGLVRCYTEGSGVWGICSWRNIIEGYNLSGAVTEVNAECYAALDLTAVIAERLGRSEEARVYGNSAEQLKQAINRELVSEKTGMYLLNLGNDRVRHHDVTGDLVFPVMFGVADEGMQERILERLTNDDMWTVYGVHTVGKHEKKYDPDFGYQLTGGVWPNLTAWVAFCVREQRPERLTEAMKNIYKLSEPERPLDFGYVVPGEFPERLHGETFKSRGMAMSPWMPPTFLWLGVEGLLGVKPTLEGLEINPRIPADWKWIGVENLLYRRERISAFLWDGTLYCTHRVKSSYPLKLGSSISTSSDHEALFTIGMEVQGELFVFVAADCDAEGNVFIEYEGKKLRKHVRIQKGEAILLGSVDLRETAEAVTAAVRQ